MNIAQIEDAASRNLPFTLKVADGDEYAVPNGDYIFFPPQTAKKRTFVVIYNDDDYASILPLLTITSLTQRAQHEA